MVAHKTLIAEYKDGGLKLIDLLTRKHSLRLKIVKKFIDPAVEAWWKDYMSKWLGACRQFGKYNLCQIPPRATLAGLVRFELEVMDAWRLLRPSAAQPESLGSLLSMPL